MPDIMYVATKERNLYIKLPNKNMSQRTYVLIAAIALLIALASSFGATTNASNATSASIAVNLTSELNNSRASGYNFTSNEFAANSPAQCSLSLITRCDNNVPSQFICINIEYNQTYSSQTSKINSNLSSGYACPEYVLAGIVSCGISQGDCVVLKSPPNYTVSNSSTANYTSTYSSTATTIPKSSSTISYTSTVPQSGSSSVSITGLINRIVQFIKDIFAKL